MRLLQFYSDTKLQWIIILFVFFFQSTHAQIDPCLNLVNLTCGSSSNFSLPSAAGSWNPTGPWGTPGSEAVFSFTPLTSGSYTITITNFVILFLDQSLSNTSSILSKDSYILEYLLDIL